MEKIKGVLERPYIGKWRKVDTWKEKENVATLKREAANCSETLITFYTTAQQFIPEDLTFIFSAVKSQVPQGRYL
jgi:hypothetical protein